MYICGGLTCSVYSTLYKDTESPTISGRSAPTGRWRSPWVMARHADQLYSSVSPPSSLLMSLVAALRGYVFLIITVPDRHPIPQTNEHYDQQTMTSADQQTISGFLSGRLGFVAVFTFGISITCRECIFWLSILNGAKKILKETLSPTKRTLKELWDD
ncbi:hypothetical protein WN51_05397 [Melipona quadrifasciata]|uniref:Uncharacterized protein n=1 Tax=Melipona quadrifasciata TaxID=166423 RepID=A0A0M8ZVW3_9HYME|nr:hypothetical protein WN51_05397 [Melipona quadrifasciata]